MTSRTNSSVVQFKGFTLEFRVDRAASQKKSKALCPPGESPFFFAAGEVWLAMPSRSALLLDDESASNLLETIRHLDRKLIEASKGGVALSGVIEKGQWAPWMKGYWARVDQGRAELEDEEIYERLADAIVVDAKSGCVAVYRHLDSVVVEACLRSDVDDWLSVYDTPDVGELRTALVEISTHILGYLRS